MVSKSEFRSKHEDLEDQLSLIERQITLLKRQSSAPKLESSSSKPMVE